MLLMLRYGLDMATRSPHTPAATVRAQLAAYPTLRQAAKMLGVATSSLSRRRGLVFEIYGREHRLSPRAVMVLASYYQRRSEYEVAGSLLDYACEHAPNAVKDVEQELDEYLQATSERDAPLDADAFLAAVKHHLPADLYAIVKNIYLTSGGK